MHYGTSDGCIISSPDGDDSDGCIISSPDGDDGVWHTHVLFDGFWDECFADGSDGSDDRDLQSSVWVQGAHDEGSAFKTFPADGSADASSDASDVQGSNAPAFGFGDTEASIWHTHVLSGTTCDECFADDGFRRSNGHDNFGLSCSAQGTTSNGSSHFVRFGQLRAKARIDLQWFQAYTSELR